MSFLFLGNLTLNSRSAQAEKVSLSLCSQELRNINMSADSIQTLISSKYASAKDHTELSYVISASFAFLHILLGSNTAYAL